jgi:hypothetical protein
MDLYGKDRVYGLLKRLYFLGIISWEESWEIGKVLYDLE